MDADAQPLVVVEDEQPILTLDQQSVLVLFNLVISIECNATPTYIAEIVEAAGRHPPISTMLQTDR